MSTELSSKPQLCNLLRYITNEALEGREENLKGYTIGLEVYKKVGDFDPEHDPIVRIHAGRLRRMLKLYYLETGKDDPVIIEIPKGRYIPVFIAKRAALERRSAEHGEPENTKSNPSVAILPFKNLSGDADKDYFALGFSEELSVELTNYEDLVVYDIKPPSDALATQTDPRDYLKHKGVHFIVEGGVQSDGKRIKVLLRLIDLKEDEQIWAKRYLRNLTADNLIEIQEIIVNDIAGIIGSEYGIILQKLTQESKWVRPQNLDTYTAILKFYHFEAQQTPETALVAFNALETALKNEPGSGIATALLASFYGNRYMLDYPDAERSYKLAGELAEKAKKLDPNSLIVQVILIFKHLIYNERDMFLEEAEWFLAKDPKNSIRLGSVGFHLALFGFWDRGKELLDRVMQSNISYPLYFHGATTLYFYRQRQYQEALTEAIKYNVPGLFWGHLVRAAVLGQLGRMEEAQKDMVHLMKLKPDFTEKAGYLISRFVKEPELVEQIIAGLRKAGMSMPLYRHSTFKDK